MTRKNNLATAYIFLTLILATHAFAAECDLVINNDRAMDPETMFVGIRDGAITVTTKAKITGNETIDATGLMVAPGFVDIHAHGQNQTRGLVLIIQHYF
jgi:imidazolonepropionase-like amidohydrolase